MNNKAEQLKWHFIGWGFLLLYELGIVFLRGGFTDPVWKIVSFYLVNICLFYSNFFFLRHIEKKQRKQVKMLLWFLFQLIIYNWVIILVNRIGNHSSALFKHVLPSSRTIGLTTARGIYFLLLSFASWKTYYAYLSQKENSRLIEESLQNEMEKLAFANEKLQLQQEVSRSEILYLKAQVNPHFIYNTLSYLYNGLEGRDNDRAEALLLLSDMLRYNLTDVPDSGKISLESDIKNIEVLVRLAKLRYKGRCYINIKIQGKTIVGYIIPMILGTLVENIFKHGDISDPTIPACIYIHIQDSCLLFRTENKVKKSVTRDDRPHTGLMFATKRLEHAYGTNFSLEYTELDGKFETKLKLPIS